MTPHLTAREIQVLHAVATGHSTEETGRRVFLGPRQVKWHLTRAARALGTRDRTHTVAEAFRLGYLAIDPVTRAIVANPYGRPVRPAALPVEATS